MRHFVVTANSTGEELAEYQRALLLQLIHFPQMLQTYLKDCSLHDAQLLEWRMDHETANLRLRFRADVFVKDSDITSFPTPASGELSLVYTDVVSFKATVEGGRVPQNPAGAGFGDVDHDRLSVISTGRYQHRIFFCSGVVMVVKFRGFEFTQTNEA